ncbi:MAG: tetratricopeptide repeat protein [Pirellulaceae bacterium]
MTVPQVSGAEDKSDAGQPDAASGLSGVEETAEEQRERLTAQRFLELLKQRPRLGTALDRVYGYHVGRGTLDEFSERLQREASAEDDGALWMVHGMLHMRRGQDAVAVDSLEKAEQLLPEEPLASYYLGKSLVMVGEIERATESLRRSIENQPSRADLLNIFQDLGRIYQRTGRNERALEVWAELEELFPNDTGVREQIAAILAEEGATEAALERYQALAESVQDRFRQVEMAIRAAQLKAKLGRTEEALEDFESQLAVVNPDSWLYRDIRGRIEEVFWASSDFDGLVDYYREWTEEHPDDIDAMLRTARVLSNQKRTPEALEWFRQAIERAPSATEARGALVDALETDRRYGEAAEAMEQLVELEPRNPDYLVRWGRLVMADEDRPKAERQREAREIWSRMLETRADDPVTVSRLADLLRGAELEEAAIDRYRQAIKLADDDPQYREYLGEYLHQLSRQDEAVAVWEELASGERRTRENLVRLSEVFNTFGYDEQALERIAEACEMDPGFGERARYAELLREAEQYDAALEQLDLAEPLADDTELMDLLTSERIKNYQAAGTLGECIAELEAAVDGEAHQDAVAWRKLALFREADRKFQAAREAIEQATELAAEDAMMWETAAGLYERTGRLGEAVTAYRKLATMDRRFLSNHLKQIAALEMRLGNADAALEAGDELLAAAPGNSENYRFYADLCTQAGRVEQGLDALRRNVRANPNDRDALDFLASRLADEFKTDEAIELYWRSFELANSVDAKLPTVESLTELYLRTNRFDQLLERLELISREENRPRDGTLWLATAHRAAGDLGMARDMLEELVREDSRDTNLLDQLVNLSKSEADYQAAVDYQRRLVSISPSPQREYQLAQLLLEIGELDQAEALWMKTTSGRGGAGDLAATITQLVGKDQFETAIELSQRGLQRDPEDWELMVVAIHAYVFNDQLEEAKQLADRLASLPIDPSEPSQATRQAMQRYNSSQSASPRANPYANISNRASQLSAIRQMQSSLQPSSNDSFGGGYGSRSGGSRRIHQPRSFGEAQSLAVGLELMSTDDAQEKQRVVEQRTEQALASGDVDQLWDAIERQVWIQPNSVYSNSGAPVDQQIEQCLEALVEQDDTSAAQLLLSRNYNVRHSNIQQGVEPMSDKELQELQRLVELANRGFDSPRNPTYALWLIDEMRRADKPQEAEEHLEQLIADDPQPDTMLRAASTSIQMMVMNANPDEEQAASSVEFSLSLIIRAIRQSDSGTQNVSSVGRIVSHMLPMLYRYGEREQVLRLVDEMLRLQARLTAAMRPSQRDRLQTSRAVRYSYQVAGNYQQALVDFPPPTGYFDQSSIMTLHAVFQASDEEGESDAVLKELAKWAGQASEDPYPRFAYLMAQASFEHWMGRPKRALETITQANELNLGSQFTQLITAKMNYETGDLQAALDVIERFRPPNQRLLVDRELTRLQLLLELGDLERSKESAQKLFALRLDSDTEFKLAELMYQLGMQELGERMMSRIRRRAGGKQETLVKLMQRYSRNGELKQAAEVAQQVMRRTSPAASTARGRTSSNVQHEQALRVLAQADRLEPLIERYEGLVHRSPNSTQAVAQLAALYEAAGRREDAQKLLSRAAESSPRNNPQAIFAAGQSLASAGTNQLAVEKFVEAIKLDPNLLNNNYHQMRDAFTKSKAWPKLVDAMIESGIEKFAQNYRLGEISRALIEAEQYEAINDLLRSAVQLGNLNAVGNILGSSNLGNILGSSNLSGDFEVADDIAELVAEQLKQASNATNNVSYLRSTSSDGTISGIPAYLVNVIRRNPQTAKSVREELKEQLEADANQLFPRVVLCTLLANVSGDQQDVAYEELEKLIEPLLDGTVTDPQLGQALWALASELVGEERSPELAVEILEHVVNSELDGNLGSSDFRVNPKNLLVTAYERLDERDKARELLVNAMESMEVDQTQNQHNPGYGEYRFMDSMAGVARQLLAMQRPIEARIAYEKSYGNPELVSASSRWGGNIESQAKSLLDSIERQTTAEVVIDAVRLAIGDSSDNGHNADHFLTQLQQTGSTMVDTRVEMPLESYLQSIEEQDQLSASVRKLLEETELAAEPTLPRLVARLAVARTVESQSSTEQCMQGLRDWLEQHPATDGDKASDDGNDREDASDAGEDGAKDHEPDRRLTNELLLAVAARNLPEHIDQREELAERMLERAMRAADRADQQRLAFGLRCQVASLVADRDPDRASRMFMQALGELLPPDSSTN